MASPLIAVIPDFLQAYQRTYIERDARLVGYLQDWRQFAHFLPLCGALTAQEINQAQLGRDIGATAQAARRWLDMLQATFQWHEVPAWSTRSAQRVAKRAKGYLADSGLV